MALAAAQVIDALAALLVPMSATGGRVYTSRTWPLDEASMPAWRITAGSEGITGQTLDGGVQRHELVVDAQCTARATADLDDTLHDLAAAGIALLFAGVPPYGLQMDAIDRELATEGEAAVGRITLRLSTVFHTAPGAPETIL